MYILFDIAASKTRAAASIDCHEIPGEPIVFDDTGSMAADTQRIAEAANTLVGNHGITATAGGLSTA